jgi:hypothetical protein
MRRLLLALAVLASGTAHAAEKAPPSPETLPETAYQFPPATCAFWGETQQTWMVDYIQPPGDTYFTLLGTVGCPNCPPTPGLGLVGARIVLNYPSPSSHRLIVSVVGATGTAECPVPDPATVLWGPVDFVVNVTVPGTVNHRAPLPLPGPALSGAAFLRVEVPDQPISGARPRLVTSGACWPCASYNHYPGHQDDLCDLQFPGRPTMYVEAGDCLVTPTLRRSWGQVRSIYRD